MLSRAREIVRLEDRGEPIQARTAAGDRTEGPLALSSQVVGRDYIVHCNDEHYMCFPSDNVEFPQKEKVTHTTLSRTEGPRNITNDQSVRKHRGKTQARSTNEPPEVS